MILSYLFNNRELCLSVNNTHSYVNERAWGPRRTGAHLCSVFLQILRSFLLCRPCEGCIDVHKIEKKRMEESGQLWVWSPGNTQTVLIKHVAWMNSKDKSIWPAKVSVYNAHNFMWRSKLRSDVCRVTWRDLSFHKAALDHLAYGLKRMNKRETSRSHRWHRSSAFYWWWVIIWFSGITEIRLRCFRFDEVLSTRAAGERAGPILCSSRELEATDCVAGHFTVTWPWVIDTSEDPVH